MTRPPAHPRRLAYLGTPEAAVPPLGALVDGGWAVDLVVSRPDRRRRRRAAPEPSPVKAAALELGLPVTDRLEDLVESDADLGVVVAYGRIIPSDLLDRLPMVNLHFSLLPRWRGAAPVERAILAGDRETGVCVMELVPELDAGPVFARARVPVGEDTASELRARMVSLGTDLLMAALADGLSDPSPQTGDATYADKIEPEDLQLDWTRPSSDLLRVIRLERAWTTFRGDRLLVLEAGLHEGPSLAPGLLAGPVVGTADRPILLGRVQAAGRGPTNGRDWANGARPAVDEHLGEAA